MDKRLEKIMQDSLGVTVADVERMSAQELHELYERAMENEVDKAIKAIDTTERGESQESIDAAHVVDWLWDFSHKAMGKELEAFPFIGQ